MSTATEWKFPSSSSDAIYTTKRNADGSLSCNCKGWLIKRGDQPRSCTHTKRVEGQVTASRPASPDGGPSRVADVAAAKVEERRLTSASEKVPAPMLASAMVVPLKGAAFDRQYGSWLLEEKHDGHRVSIRVGAEVTAWSRPRAGGESLTRNLPDAIRTEMRRLSPGVYDGELVVPGGKSWDVTTIGSRLVFVAFDLIERHGQDLTRMPYEQRRERMLDELRKLPKGQTSVSCTTSNPARWSDVEAIWKRGGEGAILKRPGSTYRPGYRSAEWIKVKESNAATFTITGFEAGKMGPYSKFKLRDATGHDTTCKVLGNAMLAECAKAPQSFIGRRAVISYQMKTPNGSYRHGVFDHFAGEGE